MIVPPNMSPGLECELPMSQPAAALSAGRSGSVDEVGAWEKWER